MTLATRITAAWQPVPANWPNTEEKKTWPRMHAHARESIAKRRTIRVHTRSCAANSPSQLAAAGCAGLISSRCHRLEPRRTRRARRSRSEAFSTLLTKILFLGHYSGTSPIKEEITKTRKAETTKEKIGVQPFVLSKFRAFVIPEVDLSRCLLRGLRVLRGFRSLGSSQNPPDQEVWRSEAGALVWLTAER